MASRDAKSDSIIKPGTVVIVLAGRFAGRKALVVKAYDDGSEDRPYPHALLAGIDRYPKRYHKRMSEKVKASRSKIKPFAALMNYNHILPTRYAMKLDLNKEIVNKAFVSDKAKSRRVRHEVRQKFQTKYLSNTNPWFFQKLRF